MAAFRAYLNYDGAGHGFGNTYLKTDISDPSITNRAAQNERITAYSSIDANDPTRMVIVAINKSQTATLSAGFQVTHSIQFSQAEVYRITGGVGSCSGPAHIADTPITLKNAFTMMLPPSSISTIVLKASQSSPLPPQHLQILP
jgi:hypothetical protein